MTSSSTCGSLPAGGGSTGVNWIEPDAEVFKTVDVDVAYYAFPRHECLESRAKQVPDDFRSGFKMTPSLNHSASSPTPTLGLLVNFAVEVATIAAAGLFEDD